MHLLLIASPGNGSSDPDTAGIPEAAGILGHAVTVLKADEVDIARRCSDALPVDAAICRFANQPRAIDAAIALERKGVPVINRGQPVSVAADQRKTLDALSTAGIAVPRTVVVTRESDPESIAREVGFPAVCKLPSTSGGRGVWLVGDKAELESCIRSLAETDVLLLQRFYLEANSRDLRLLVVGGELKASMLRVAAPGEWRANLQLGATGYPHLASPLQRRLGLAAARAIDIDICGVDIITTNDGLLVLEVNPKPGNDISRITGVDIATHIVHLAVGRTAGRRAN